MNSNKKKIPDDYYKKLIKIYRIVVLGVVNVGKTQIIQQYVNNSFETEYYETKDDLRCYNKLINLNEETDEQPSYVILRIEDMFGINHPCIENSENPSYKDKLLKILQNKQIRQEGTKVNPNHRLYYPKQIYAYVFVFDASQLNSLHFLKSFFDYIKKEEDLNQEDQPNFKTKKYIVANKSDLLESSELASLKSVRDAYKEINSYQLKYDLEFQIVSALLNENIAELFESIAKDITSNPIIEQNDQNYSEMLFDLIPKKEEKRFEDNKPKAEPTLLDKLGCGPRKKKQQEASDSEEEDQIQCQELAQDNTIPYKQVTSKDKCNII